MRTGGLTPDAFPACGRPGALSVALRRRDVPFKATAGLHHPVRSMQRCTYEADSPTALMHGFVNVFLAAALLWHGGSARRRARHPGRGIARCVPLRRGGVSNGTLIA